MNNTPQEIAHYFVKMDDSEPWEIAFWDGEVWFCVGSDQQYGDGIFDIVGDKIILPE